MVITTFALTLPCFMNQATPVLDNLYADVLRGIISRNSDQPAKFPTAWRVQVARDLT